VLVQTWPSTILVVSHDREFLNTIATDVLHLHSGRVDAYHGDYDTFVKTKTERLKNQQREYDAQTEYREHIQVSSARFTLVQVSSARFTLVQVSTARFTLVQVSTARFTDYLTIYHTVFAFSASVGWAAGRASGL